MSFPALGLRLKLVTTYAIIVATAVLHNIACGQREEIPAVYEEEEAAIELMNKVDVDDPQYINREDQIILLD